MIERSDVLGQRQKVEESVQMYSETELKGILSEQVQIASSRYRKGTVLQFLLEYHTMAGNTPGIILSTLEDIMEDYGFLTRPPEPPQKEIRVQKPGEKSPADMEEKIRGKTGEREK